MTQDAGPPAGDFDRLDRPASGLSCQPPEFDHRRSKSARSCDSALPPYCSSNRLTAITAMPPAMAATTSRP
jgi:hypothetical protein